jgi:hypothetical protein
MYVCTFKPRAKGVPRERYFADINSLKHDQPSSVVQALQQNFSDLEIKLARNRAWETPERTMRGSTQSASPVILEMCQASFHRGSTTWPICRTRSTTRSCSRSRLAWDELPKGGTATAQHLARRQGAQQALQGGRAARKEKYGDGDGGIDGPVSHNDALGMLVN